MTKPIFFLHMPKTAGTSIGEMFKDVYGEGAVYHFEQPAPISPPRAEKLSSCYFVFGHLPFHQCAGIDGSWFRFTMLRNPDDRFLSNYYWMREAASQLLHDENVQNACRFSLEEFVEHYQHDHVNNVVNTQTSMLVNLTAMPSVNDEAILSEARTSLATFDFVGLHEEFEASLHCLCHLNGLPPFAEMKHANVTKHRASFDQLSSDLQRRITELNDLDWELYRLATQLHRKARNRVLSSLSRSASGAPAPSPGVVTPKSAPSSPALTYFQSTEVRVLHVSMSYESREAFEFQPGDLATIYILLASEVDCDDVTVGFHIENQFREVVFGTNSHIHRQPLHVCKGGLYRVEYSLALNLGEGDYAFGVSVHTKDTHLERCFAWQDRVVRFSVRNRKRPEFTGYCRLAPVLTLVDCSAQQRLLRQGGTAGLALAIHQPPRLLPRNSEQVLLVRVTNGSLHVWGLAAQLASLSYHWFRGPGSEVVMADGPRLPFAAPIDCGQEMLVPVKVLTPDEDGPYRLRVSIVLEHQLWLEQCEPPVSADLELTIGGER